MATGLKSDLELKLELDKPSESVQKKALVELRETPENIEEGLRELKKLLEADKDLIVPITNDEWLLKFLRTSKFYPESARNLIRRSYSLLYKYSEIKILLLPSKLQHVFEANLVSILPQRDQHGRRIIVTLNGKQWNHKVISLPDVFSSGVLCRILLEKEPETQINGVVFILDLEDFSVGHAIQYKPYNVKRCLDFIQEQSPVRIKGFHIVNSPKIFHPIFAAVKTFFSAKSSKRILMHGNNYESLHRYISPECLPKCYGGTLNSQLMHSPETFQLLAQHEKYFEELQRWGLI